MPPVQFRVSAAEYAALAAAAAADGVSANDMARRLMLASLRVTPPGSVLHGEASAVGALVPRDSGTPPGVGAALLGASS